MLRSLVFLLAPGLLAAQVPRVGVIDFYGLRKLSEERVRKVLGVQEGDRLPASKGALEEKLEQIPGVVMARVEAVCCAGDRAILYVGIEGRGAPHFEFREPPAGAARLPDDILESYREFLRAFEQAARAGDTAEDMSAGHPLAANAAVRAWQEKFQVIASANLALLRDVLRNSDQPDHRATAAAIIGYAAKKEAVIPDLQYAMQDADESVRANAMRALGAIASAGFKVEPTWFVEMLNSIVWSDRYRAAQALTGITAARSASVLSYLRERALESLQEMARWKTPAHAWPAFVLVGRIKGLTEEQIEAEFKKRTPGPRP